MTRRRRGSRTVGQAFKRAAASGAGSPVTIRYGAICNFEDPGKVYRVKHRLA